MNIPNGYALFVLARVAVQSAIIGAAAGGVIIALAYKGRADGKKERGE